MSYSARDKSADNGAPLSLYKIETPRQTYYYTSYHDEVLYAGDTYEPFQISHSTIEVTSSLNSSTTTDIVVPNTSQLALDYAFSLSPQSLTVTIYSAHVGEAEVVVEWEGVLVACETSTDETTIKTISKMQEILKSGINPVLFKSLCNHKLYDSRCGVIRADHTFVTTVVKVEGKSITVTDDGFIDAALNRGTILSTANDEVRNIVTNVGNVITVPFEFIDLNPGDTVELSRGCDLARLGNCKNVFNNVERYGGFDFIPFNVLIR